MYREDGQIIKVKDIWNWDEIHDADGRVYYRAKWDEVTQSEKNRLNNSRVEDLIEEDGYLVIYLW